MQNKPQKYHLYMDETSQFEGNTLEIANAQPLLYALLVPDEVHDELGKEFITLRKRNGFQKPIHGVDHFSTKQYKLLCNKLVKLTTSSPIMTFAITYVNDLCNDCPEELQESFAVNRYLSMAQTILEYILFLHPDFKGKDITFNIKPNSRVISDDNLNNLAVEKMNALGFSSSKNYSDDSNRYYIWGNDSLRGYLHRMFLDYAPLCENIGRRSWGQVKTIVAARSTDPFVEWVDILTGMYRWDEHNTLVKKLKDSLSADLQYGPQHQKFKELAQLDLAGDLTQFLTQTLQYLPFFSAASYQTILEKLYSQAIANTSPANLKDLQLLEQYLDNLLKSSSGKHALATQIITSLENSLTHLTTKSMSNATRRLQLKINSHKVSIHNHRGEFLQALDAYYDAKDLEISPMDITDYRERIELENRLTVSIANIFAFQEGTDLLEPILLSLEKSLQPLNDQSGLTIADPLIGKIRGTLGQNYAFSAPTCPAYYEKAEKLFLKAAQEFSSPADKMRHDINLFHLYTDWQKTEMAKACIDEIISSETLAPFLADQNPENAEGVQFALLAYIKYCYFTKQNFETLTTIFSLPKLKALFTDSITEHPFQFICSYLARMAITQKDVKIAESFFDHALKIPAQGKRKEQPTLETIRAQILTLQALAQSKDQRKLAQENMQKTVGIMAEIGRNSDYTPILSITDRKISGWFGKSWQALRMVDWQKDFSEDACKAFLNCFTFNYH